MNQQQRIPANKPDRPSFANLTPNYSANIVKEESSDSESFVEPNFNAKKE